MGRERDLDCKCEEGDMPEQNAGKHNIAIVRHKGPA